MSTGRDERLASGLRCSHWPVAHGVTKGPIVTRLYCSGISPVSTWGPVNGCDVPRTGDGRSESKEHERDRINWLVPRNAVYDCAGYSFDLVPAVLAWDRDPDIQPCNASEAKVFCPGDPKGRNLRCGGSDRGAQECRRRQERPWMHRYLLCSPANELEFCCAAMLTAHHDAAA